MPAATRRHREKDLAVDFRRDLALCVRVGIGLTSIPCLTWDFSKIFVYLPFHCTKYLHKILRLKKVRIIVLQQ